MTVPLEDFDIRSSELIQLVPASRISRFMPFHLPSVRAQVAPSSPKHVRCSPHSHVSSHSCGAMMNLHTTAAKLAHIPPRRSYLFEGSEDPSNDHLAANGANK